jgi:hypothetical protein
MEAKFNGKCAACGKFHIKAGDKITGYMGGWAIPACADAKFDILQLKQHVEYVMLEEHKMWCGILDCPDNVKGFDTRHKFYHKALELGVITQSQYDDIRHEYPYIWDKDLCD